MSFHSGHAIEKIKILKQNNNGHVNFYTYYCSLGGMNKIRNPCQYYEMYCIELVIIFKGSK